MNKIRDFLLKASLLIVGLSTLISCTSILLIYMLMPNIDSLPQYILIILNVCIVIWAIWSLAVVLCIAAILVYRSIKHKENFFDNLKNINISL